MYVHLFEAPIRLLSICKLVRSGINVCDDSLVCSILAVWFLTAETFTHWLSVALVGERLFALNWPFLARRVSSARKALLLCALVLFFVAMLQVRAGLTPYLCVQLSNSCIQWLFYHKLFECFLSHSLDASIHSRRVFHFAECCLREWLHLSGESVCQLCFQHYFKFHFSVRLLCLPGGKELQNI